MIRIAIFADIHGKILLPFKMVDSYQKMYGEKIDFILQCGDIGAFPDTKKMDKATIKHARRDDQELGYSKFFVKTNPTVKAFLNDLNIDMICVRGNHEDHDYLDQFEEKSSNSLFPIDAYHRVYVCKSGMYQSFKKGDEEIVFMGIGRVGDRKGRDESRFIREYEQKVIKQSLKENRKIDILISHDISSDMTYYPGFGLDDLRPILNQLKPALHFYGHTEEPYRMERDLNGYTYSVKIKELAFNNSGMLNDGCMIILENEYDEFEMKVVERSFIDRFQKNSWLSI